MISTIEFEKCVADVGILDIVVSELCYEKKPCPIILLEVDKRLEVGFHCIIMPLSLTVRLQLESGKESPLDAEEIA